MGRASQGLFDMGAPPAAAPPGRRRHEAYPRLLRASAGLIDAGRENLARGTVTDQRRRGAGGVQGGLWSVYRTQGIGIYFVLAGTLFILLQIVMSVVKAASKGKPPRSPGPGARRGRRR